MRRSSPQVCACCTTRTSVRSAGCATTPDALGRSRDPRRRDLGCELLRLRWIRQVVLKHRLRGCADECLRERFRRYLLYTESRRLDHRAQRAWREPPEPVPVSLLRVKGVADAFLMQESEARQIPQLAMLSAEHRKEHGGVGQAGDLWDS